MNRRTFLTTAGAVSLTALAGCSSNSGSTTAETTETTTTATTRDTDGDGVIDDEDYASRDPEVQTKDDLQDDDPENAQAGVDISQTSSGDNATVTVTLITLSNADKVTATHDGQEKTLTQVGGSVTFDNLQSGDTVTVTATLDGKTNAIQLYTVK